MANDFTDALKGIDDVRDHSNPSFRFVVIIANEPVAAFTEVTLPTVEWDMLKVEEGGLNTYVHQLPGRRTKNQISLKNGVGLGTVIADWYIDAMSEKFSEARKTIDIKFYSGPDRPLMTWSIEDCIPIKWTGPALKSDSNAIAIQTLDLACGEISITKTSGAAPAAGAPYSKWVPKAPRVKKGAKAANGRRRHRE